LRGWIVEILRCPNSDGHVRFWTSSGHAFNVGRSSLGTGRRCGIGCRSDSRACLSFMMEPGREQSASSCVQADQGHGRVDRRAGADCGSLTGEADETLHTLTHCRCSCSRLHHERYRHTHF
jgi:hypothetical protein